MTIIRCPHCRKSLRDISDELNRLKKENAKFAKLNRKLEDEIEYLRGGFVASKNRHTFHRKECKWAEYILFSPNLIEFSSHQEAIDAGYKPCKTCRA